MSRKDFISDQLVDMRSQLRDSYTSYHQNRASRDAAATPQDTPETATAKETAKTPAVENISAGKYLPSMQNTNDRSANARERRELEGRIIHDLAAIDREREKLQTKLEELEKFAGVLKSSRQEITTGDIGKIGRDYFAASGRWSAFDERYEKSVTANAPTGGFDRKGFWIVAGAVLLGSLIVAFALIKSFSV